MILLNKHGFTNKNKLKIDGYTTFSKNRENKIMGGVSISTKKHEAQHVLKIKEGEKDDEFLIVKHEKYKPAINVMTIYGEQESRVSKTEILEKWKRILEEIYNVLSRGENLVILGDFNKHIGSDHLGVYGNHDKITYGGSLVRDLVNSGDIILVNNTNKCEGGPFTKKDPSDPNNDNKKSCLDLCLVSKDLFRYIDKLIIDKNEQFEMGRVVVKNDIKILVKPDHYTLVIYFKNIPLNRSIVKKVDEVRFNLRKKDGWNTCKDLTEKCDELIKIVENEKENIERVYEQFEKVHNKIKFKSFGKTRIKSNDNKIYHKNIADTHHKDENNMIDEIMKQKSARLENRSRCYISSWKSTKRWHIKHTRKEVIENRFTFRKTSANKQSKIYKLGTIH